MVTLEPRLEPDMPAHARSEIQTRKVLLPLKTWDLPHRRHILEPSAPTRRQQPTPLDRTRSVNLQVPQRERPGGVDARSGGRHTTNRHHTPDLVAERTGPL
ncbi:hypothetical protein ABIA39_007513 [Nocardia sp. GAS34]|uniref:hypothetical protein n=1 Tax=unclassified Nocardia TaxID=2637762 RepID=UPI003D201248